MSAEDDETGATTIELVGGGRIVGAAEAAAGGIASGAGASGATSAGMDLVDPEDEQQSGAMMVCV